MPVNHSDLHDILAHKMVTTERSRLCVYPPQNIQYSINGVLRRDIQKKGCRIRMLHRDHAFVNLHNGCVSRKHCGGIFEAEM